MLISHKLFICLQMGAGVQKPNSALLVRDMAELLCTTNSCPWPVRMTQTVSLNLWSEAACR